MKRFFFFFFRKEVKRDYNQKFKTKALNDLCNVVFVEEKVVRGVFVSKGSGVCEESDFYEERVVYNDLGSFIKKVISDKSVDYQYTAELKLAINAVEDYIYYNEMYDTDVILALRDAHANVECSASIFSDKERHIYVNKFFAKIYEERDAILMNKLSIILADIDNCIPKCLMYGDKRRLNKIKNELDEIHTNGICIGGIHELNYIIAEAITIMSYIRVD